MEQKFCDTHPYNRIYRWVLWGALRFPFIGIIIHAALHVFGVPHGGW